MKNLNCLLATLAMTVLPIEAAIGASPSSNKHEGSMKDCCPVIELRQYTMYPGRRDELITLFENAFIESQEAVGIHVAAQFRDANDADRFVWIRGFDSMEAREAGLNAFYFGPVWQAHRDKANATLADNDNVLLLRPAAAGSGFAPGPTARPAKGAASRPAHLIVATIYYLREDVAPDSVAAFGRDLVPMVEQSGARVLARYVTDKSKNNFPRLPVREKENVFVWFGEFENRRAYDSWLEALARNPRWRDEVLPRIQTTLQRPPETLILQPTARSLVR